MKHHDAPRNAVCRDRARSPADWTSTPTSQDNRASKRLPIPVLSDLHTGRSGRGPRPSCLGWSANTSSAAPLVMAEKCRRTRPVHPACRHGRKPAEPLRVTLTLGRTVNAQGSVDVQPTRHLGRPPGHPSPIGQHAHAVRPRIDTTSQRSYVQRVVTRSLGRIHGQGPTDRHRDTQPAKG
jgi:hypothetical protein